jgi:hypothetical protein
LGNKFGHLLSELAATLKGINGNSDFKHPDSSFLLSIAALPEGW